MTRPIGKQVGTPINTGSPIGGVPMGQRTNPVGGPVDSMGGRGQGQFINPANPFYVQNPYNAYLGNSGFMPNGYGPSAGPLGGYYGMYGSNPWMGGLQGTVGNIFSQNAQFNGAYGGDVSGKLLSDGLIQLRAMQDRITQLSKPIDGKSSAGGPLGGNFFLDPKNSQDPNQKVVPWTELTKPGAQGDSGGSKTGGMTEEERIQQLTEAKEKYERFMQMLQSMLATEQSTKQAIIQNIR